MSEGGNLQHKKYNLNTLVFKEDSELDSRNNQDLKQLVYIIKLLKEQYMTICNRHTDRESG